MHRLFDLSDRVALVTGASRGIGEATARLLAEHGAHVIISSRKQEACEAVAESIRAGGGKATAIAAHQGTPEALETLVAQAEREAKRLQREAEAEREKGLRHMLKLRRRAGCGQG